MNSNIEMYVASIKKSHVTLKMTYQSKRNNILIPTSAIPDTIKDKISTSPKFFKLENDVYVVKTIDCPKRHSDGKFIRDNNNKIISETISAIEENTLIAPISNSNNRYKINNQLINIKENPTNKLFYFMEFLDGFLIKKETDYSLIQTSFLTLEVPTSYFDKKLKLNEIIVLT